MVCADLFDDYIYDPINFIGLLIGFSGGVLYSYITYADRQNKSLAPPASAAVAPKAPAVSDATATDGGEEEEAAEGAALLNASSSSSSAAPAKGAGAAGGAGAAAEDGDSFGLDHDRGLVRRGAGATAQN